MHTAFHQYFLASLLLLVHACHNPEAPHAGQTPGGDSFKNPLLPAGPDPWVMKKGSVYYYTATTGKNISIRATRKMSDLGKTVPKIVWTPPPTGSFSREIWAPEIHFLHNRWYIYFAADDGHNENHRIFALECDGPDPLSDHWTFKGKIANKNQDNWAIDASVFEYRDQLYMVWSGWAGKKNVAQNIYIAKMKDPLTLEGARVMIASPTFSWERSGGPPAVNEGPEMIFNEKGRLFMTFSAGGCWTDQYCLGLMTLRANGDPLDPGDWTKAGKPVFSTSADSAVYSPGHNGFFKSADGSEDWIIYHANAKPGQGCGDTRSPRMQRISWKKDGTPDFGYPLSIQTSILKPKGE